MGWPFSPNLCVSPQGEYYLKDFVLDPSVIPSIIPEGRYKINLAIFQPMPSHKHIYGTEIIFSLMKRT